MSSPVLDPPSPGPATPAPRRPVRGEAAEAAAPARSRAQLALLLALALGVALRLLQYAVNRALWLDEGLLVSNFLPRSWPGLLEPLHRGQTAPLGFLALEKALATVLGPHELVLRLVPLLAGLATLALLPRVAKRYVSRPARPLAVAIVALAPFLVYYSSEVKQYSLDAFCTVAVLGFAARLARDPHDRAAAAAFGVFGIAAVWFSQPVVFLLGGTGLVLGVRALRRGDRAALLPLVVMAAGWLASFASSYTASRHQVSDPEYMAVFWQTGFMPLPRTAADIVWLPRMLLRMFREPMGVMGDTSTGPVEWLNRAGTAAGALAFAAGCAWMWRRRRLALALLLAPLGLAVVASAARLYPLGSLQLSTGRVLVYLLPVLALVMAEGAVSLRRILPRAAAAPAFAAVVVLMLAPSFSYAALAVPQVRAEVKPLLDYAAEQRQPGDMMYVFYNGQAVFEYYAPRYGWTRANTVAGVCARFHPEQYIEQLQGLIGRPRVWVLMVWGSPVPMQGPQHLLYREDLMIVDALDHLGTKLDGQKSVGAGLFLYDLRESPSRRPFELAVPALRETASDACRGSWEWRNQLR